MNSIGKYLILTILLFSVLGLKAQTGGDLEGKVTDASTGEPLIGATVVVEGTYKGAYTADDGSFEIYDIKPGNYSVKVTYMGYTEQVQTGIQINEGQTTTLTFQMKSKEEGVTLGGVEIIGKADLVDITGGQSGGIITEEEIGLMNVQNVQDVVETQVGVQKTPDGLVIRGGRIYETQYMIEGISAKDPLAGTGFGVDVGSNAVSEVELVTGGAGAEYGNATSGVINTSIKEGSEEYHFNGSWQRDNLGFDWKPGWNTDIINVSVGGPVPFLKDDKGKHKLFFFTSANAFLSDNYFGPVADQLHSSLFENDSMWAPRQDNRWGHTMKLTWQIKNGMKLSVFNQHSLNINQNSRTLQIIGNDAIMTPGFQYIFSLDPDNANTYTHHSNLTAANFLTLLGEKVTWNVTIGRLFTNLRADANGRPFRTSTVDRIFDPASIVTDPVEVFNPNDSVVYVFPGPGLYNNGGIATLWHDHYAQEYTFKNKFTYTSANNIHFVTFGLEHKEQEYQWVDVTRPWIGAPVIIDDTTTTPSTSIGSSSDVWKARPAHGGLFVQDEIRYKGIIAYLGMRFDYWAPGKFADEAVENPDAPVLEEVREQYKKQTVPLLGRRWKARLLPKLRVSFPITENNVLYFNYGHATLMPHPRFVYAGLDPVYQDRSFLSFLGNPNINPEVTVSYEVGLKSKITQDLALTVTAFYNDKFDYIVSRRILVKDQTGRFVEKTFYINQDYARIRGLEVQLIRRFGDYLKVSLSGAYQIATGKSNTAAESALQIKQNGFVSASKEQFLAWDRPFDAKLNVFLTPDSTVKIFGLSLKNYRAYISSTFKSGLRYTPYSLEGYDDAGRPIYERMDDEPFSKLASPWFWTDVKLYRDFFFGKDNFITVSVEAKNVFNNKNAQIINGVTGKAYEPGDPLPYEARDPNYPDPQNNGTPPLNPARYLQPRQILFGVSMHF